MFDLKVKMCAVFVGTYFSAVASLHLKWGSQQLDAFQKPWRVLFPGRAVVCLDLCILYIFQIIQTDIFWLSLPEKDVVCDKNGECFDANLINAFKNGLL